MSTVQFLRNKRGWLQGVADIELPADLPPCSDSDCAAPACGDACTTAERDYE